MPRLDPKQAGYEEGTPSGWLIEGLLFYLPSQAGMSILEQVMRHAAAGSWVGFDTINTEVLTSPLTRPWVEMQKAAGAPWIGTLDDPMAFLARGGWSGELAQAGQPEANHGRWTLPVTPTAMPAMPHNWYVVARKRDSQLG